MHLAGFGNYHSSEAIPGSLPSHQNSPQQCNMGLYAEQLSGSAFTRPRHANLHSWQYRILPSVVHGDYAPYKHAITEQFLAVQAPNPFRWSTFPALETTKDFVDGLFHLAGNASVNTYIYQCNQSMDHRYFGDNDGELLFVPYAGTIQLQTEMGMMEISPGKIAVIPRGIKFKVNLIDTYAAGYLCENSGLPLSLPSLGTIGANGLAHPRHFLYPSAAFEERTGDMELICKYQNHWWSAISHHSPLNVVAWHGNYAPYCYDLSLFNTINSVSFDHPDPSIFTVLTSESDTPGVANLDFVIFPPRWMVAEDTFRPPYFHKNIMNELMGLIIGTYDAKATGFEVGGVSIHNCMTAHGPDADSFQEARAQKLEPKYYDNTLAFMFETNQPWKITDKGLHHPSLQRAYSSCWQKLNPYFKRAP